MRAVSKSTSSATVTVKIDTGLLFKNLKTTVERLPGDGKFHLRIPLPGRVRTLCCRVPCVGDPQRRRPLLQDWGKIKEDDKCKVCAKVWTKLMEKNR